MPTNQSAKVARAAAIDPLWLSIRNEVQRVATHEPILASFLYASILNHKTMEDALGFILAGKLECSVLPAMLVRELFEEACDADRGIGASIRADVRAVRERDPAANAFSEPFLYFKGFHALQTLAVAPGARGTRAVPAEPDVGGVRDGRAPGGTHRQRHHGRPRDQRGDRGDRRHRGQRLDPARGHARGHR
jgi:hypothetical protein